MKTDLKNLVKFAVLLSVGVFADINQTSAQSVSVARVGGWVSQEVGEVRSIAISGNYAYLATGAGGLQVINISNVAAPVRVGSFLGSGSVNDVAMSGNHAFLADAADGLVVLNITNPASPVRISGYFINLAKSITVSADHA